MRNIKFECKVHLGVRSNTRVAKGIAISLLSGADEADVCYYINPQVDMGVNMGMYLIIQTQT